MADPGESPAGPPGAVRSGDMIRLDVAARRIELLIEVAELTVRMARLAEKPAIPRSERRPPPLSRCGAPGR